jgi:hypothetical protein
MALLFADSFDHYVGADITKKWTSAFPGVNPNCIGVGTGRCGSNNLILTSTAFLHKGVTVSGTANKGTAGFAYNPRSFFTGLKFAGPGYGASTSAQFYAWMSADGRLNINDGNDNLRASSAPDTLRLLNWHYVEMQWAISATVGTIIVKVNNVIVINAAGLDLQDSSSLTTNWTEWVFMCEANGTNWFDDLYVLDDVNDGLTPSTHTFLGDTRVEYLRPTADGVHHDWTVTGGGTHANAVDKGSASNLTTPFIEDQVVGDIDTNDYSDPTIGTGVAYGVQVLLLAQKDSSGARTIAPVVRSGGGADAIGANQSPPQFQSTYGIQMYNRNPNTGVGWTIPEIAADQFGVKLTT